ncbi:hypothetical protein AC578_1228 [Pseudocercospora eumusae]|uniref:Uncharacterized protein n=1 Tax=Pseudocercospora eumusae TaxID=321146 RepID=A0A139HCR5_9PEZI|nr:hypothetical protein AC578_1228 [Pseudocercospora eumusae]KXT00234.1 hypothetical protein AC578_1228 [Pseudocercospora eumusae]KXT00235.1 hypothetical protein AC578_1228 [Pseudocercospora eumusae]
MPQVILHHLVLQTPSTIPEQWSMSSSSSRHENVAIATPADRAAAQPQKYAGEAGRLSGEGPIDDNEFAAEAAPRTEEDEDIPYPEAEDETQLQPPADFKPFFTLIEDPVTREHHHPVVHYVFADDDQDIITNAALETLPPKPLDVNDVEDRFIIVDMAADGKQVISATSLSANWQGLTTKVAQAPSWGDDSNLADRGLMLHISGQEARGEKRRAQGEIQGLIKAFDDHLDDLNGLLEPGDARAAHETAAMR